MKIVERIKKKQKKDEGMKIERLPPIIYYCCCYCYFFLFFCEMAFIEKEWIQGLTKRKGNQLCKIGPRETKDLWSACWWATPFVVWGRLYGWLLSSHFSGIFGVNKMATFHKCFLFFWSFFLLLSCGVKINTLSITFISTTTLFS